MRVNNKRKHAHQMRANACLSTRFSTRVCAKIVRAFCVCVGRLSLTCTVIRDEICYLNQKYFCLANATMYTAAISECLPLFPS